jgi:hypothetical protein
MSAIRLNARSNVCRYTASRLERRSRARSWRAPPWYSGATMVPAMLPMMLGVDTGPPTACSTTDGEIVTLG